MKKYDKNIDIFSKLEAPFENSKEELRKKFSKQIEEKPKAKVIRLDWVKYAVASVVLLLVGVTLFMKFNTQTIISNKGEHLSYILPDGSVIELNAETEISYKPYWWKFNREIKLTGEAFFDVKKGKKFNIISENGITEILGTSFNIYARDLDYQVFCKTGRVKVCSTKSNAELIITHP